MRVTGKNIPARTAAEFRFSRTDKEILNFSSFFYRYCLLLRAFYIKIG